MNLETMILLIVGIGVGLVCLLVIIIKIPKRLKVDAFTEQWRELQEYCRNKENWPDALRDADKLLDKALKKRKFKGRTMGERMVSAQRTFTDNDGAWFAHNIYKKIIADPNFKLKESDVKDALVGFRQALRDLGALPSGSKSRDS